MNAKTFGQIIKIQRKKLGLTQAYLAALANTGTRFISDLENGKPTVQLDKALHVANILSIKVETIV
ncbi:MAG: helix-turn-helix domain-containing protein [Acholeplasma sp.]|nr:helix-turn-helix domain-containing protein [Acholeplasma sp.]